MEPVYKIVIREGERIRTLFHGIDGSRYLSFNKWTKAKQGLVRDASKSLRYIAGIHVFKEKEDAVHYLTKFRTIKDRIVIRCYARGLRVKPSNPKVFLASEILIPNQKI